MQTKIEKIDSYSALALKNIDFNEPQSLEFLSFREKLSLANISHPAKKREWTTARLAIYEALQALGEPYPGFFKDEHGKSQSMSGHGYVSLSHTPGLAGAIFHKTQSVGIDMDLIREKILKIGFRFLDSSELDFLEKDPVHYTMAWSAKESIFKCQGKRGVSFRENILLAPFSLEDSVIKGRIRGTEFADSHYTVEVRKLENVILTYTIW
ncbi:4'-phosphopantetheinyl transferase family protein [Algoriphagus confluentis]|uniref:4'-phosphopantetheinyl transferase superfamily protein n=1 Tax=Algoriphagus confluentis TaxID=1697556 RepID=A0ABQ6PT12_9BACT|nr:4'-phosphopantetheinyl transferase superfamily protein [Algoriphagus confluentis]